MRKDKLAKEQRSLLMARVRSKNTNFEKKVFRALRRRGLRFRTHYSGVVGKPDIAIPKSRKVIFLHSDFWHGWRLSKWESVLPNKFWKQKLRKNRLRGKVVVRTLRRQGWTVLVIWEHQLEKDFAASIHKITEFYFKT